MLPSSAQPWQASRKGFPNYSHIPYVSTGRTMLGEVEERVQVQQRHLGEYLPVTSVDSISEDFTLEQSFVSSVSDTNFSESDIRVVVFQLSDNHGPPQPLFDSHRPIVVRCQDGSSPRGNRRRSSSARNIQGEVPPADRCRSGTPTSKSTRRSIGELAPLARTDASSRDSFTPMSTRNGGCCSVASSQSSITHTLAASLSSLLSTPLKTASAKDKIKATSSPATSRKVPLARAPRPNSPTLSVASRCSTPRNTLSNAPSSNAWYTPITPPPDGSTTPASGGSSPATSAKSSDHKLLGEMIDSLPMRGCQASVKIHELKSPARIMLTYNFTLYIRKHGRGSPTSDDSFCVSSCSSLGPESPASPLHSFFDARLGNSSIHRSRSDQALPRPDSSGAISALAEGRRRSSTLAANGHSGNHTAFASPALRSNSLHARRVGSATPNGHTPSSPSLLSVGSSGYNSSQNLRLSGSDSGWLHEDEPVPMKVLRFSVVTHLPTPSDSSVASVFLHTHWSLIMRHMLRVRDGIEDAVTSKVFLPNSASFKEAQQDLRHKITNLWRVPRIESPVWLTLSTFEFARCQVGCKFIRQFVRVAKEYIAGGHDQFLPSILTAVLSHHIGWVASAKDGSLQQSLTDSKLKYGSSGGCGGQNTNCNGNAGSSNDAASPGSGLADCLQIQMSEAHGALCWPKQLARTVVIGQNIDSVAVLLYLLTFFIRSSDIVDNTVDLSRDCKEVTGALMRTRTPGPQMKLDTPPASRLHVPPKTVTPSPVCPSSQRTPKSSLSKDGPALRAPLPAESNMFQSNLDRFTVNDCPPGRSGGGRPGGNAPSSYAPCPAMRRIPRAGVPIDISQNQTDTGKSMTDGEDLDSTPSGLSFRILPRAAPSDDPLADTKPSGRQASDAVPIDSEPSSLKKSTPTMSMLSTSLQQHAEAEESASRNAHQRWLEWMGSMKAVELHSPPGSPIVESKPIVPTSPFAPLHCNIGRSLFGGLCSEYQSDFILHGTNQVHSTVLRSVNNDLKQAVQHSILSRPVDSAVGVVVNTDRMSCEVLSQSKPTPNATSPSLARTQLLESRTPIEASLMVYDLLLSVVGVWDLNMSEVMCLLHLEDGLRQIVLKGKLVSEYLTRQPPGHKLDQQKLTALFGVDNSDMELLMSVNRVLWSPN